MELYTKINNSGSILSRLRDARFRHTISQFFSVESGVCVHASFIFYVSIVQVM